MWNLFALPSSSPEIIHFDLTFFIPSPLKLMNKKINVALLSEHIYLNLLSFVSNEFDWRDLCSCNINLFIQCNILYFIP